MVGVMVGVQNRTGLHWLLAGTAWLLASSACTSPLPSASILQVIPSAGLTSATPMPSAPSLTYRTQPGSPFTVIDNGEADGLFSHVDSCTNPVGRFTLSFPATWYTNPTVGTLPACSWFAPTPFSTANVAAVPREVVITIVTFKSAIGYFNAPEVTISEAISIGDHQGSRYEQIGMNYEGDGHVSLPPSYIYIANFGSPTVAGPSMQALTTSVGASHYVLDKAVLDRMMASLRFRP